MASRPHKTHTQLTLGYIAITLWCIFAAVGYIITGKSEQSADPFVICFGVFTITALFFLLCNSYKLNKLIGQIRANKQLFINLNITTLGCWMFTIYPLKYIEPSIVSAIILSTLPIGTLILSKFIYKRDPSNTTSLLSAIAYLLGIIFLWFIVKTNHSAMQGDAFTQTINLFFCMMAGFFLAANNIFAKRLSLAGWQPMDILSARFLLITVVSFLLALPHFSLLTNKNLLLDLFSIAFTLIIIQQIVFQYSLKYLEPFVIALISPFTLVLTFLAEFTNRTLHPSLWSVLGIIYILLVSITGTYLNRHRKSS